MKAAWGCDDRSAELREGRSSMKETRTANTPGTLEGQVSAADVEAILAAAHGNPFAVLGIQEAGTGFVARCFIPHAETVTALTLAGDEVGELTRLDDAGFFEGALSIAARQPLRYRARNAGGEWTITDPYSFG